MKAIIWLGLVRSVPNQQFSNIILLTCFVKDKKLYRLMYSKLVLFKKKITQLYLSRHQCTKFNLFKNIARPSSVDILYIVMKNRSLLYSLLYHIIKIVQSFAHQLGNQMSQVGETINFTAPYKPYKRRFVTWASFFVWFFINVYHILLTSMKYLSSHSFYTNLTYCSMLKMMVDNRLYFYTIFSGIDFAFLFDQENIILQTFDGIVFFLT